MLEIIDHPARADGAGAELIREIRLARPPVNALNADLLRALTASVAAPRECAALLVTGQPGIFSAGLDIRALLGGDREAVTATFTEVWRVQRAIATSPVPIVFGITGHCPAGGTVLLIHGDYRVMAQGDYRLGLNEVQVGLIPGSPIHEAFRRLTGGHGAQLLTRGALFDPATALRVGLVDELCEPTLVTARALAVARELCGLHREAMLRTRALVRADLAGLFGNPGHALVREREFAALAVALFYSADTQERMRSALPKR